MEQLALAAAGSVDGDGDVAAAVGPVGGEAEAGIAMPL